MIALNNKIRAIALIPSGYGLLRVYSDVLKSGNGKRSFINVTFQTLLSFAMYDYAPLLSLVLYYLFAFSALKTIIFLALGYLLMNSIYELGYLMNDTISRRVEGKVHKVRVKLTVFDSLLIALSRAIYVVIFTLVFLKLVGLQYSTQVILAEVTLFLVFLLYDLTPKHVRTVMLSFPLKFMKAFVLLLPFIITGTLVENVITLSFILPIAVRFSQAHYLKTACKDNPPRDFKRRVERFSMMYLQVTSLSTFTVLVSFVY